MDSPWNNLDKTLGRKSIDKPGAWGYLLTMQSIFQHAMKNDFESIAVFDDDFILSKSFDHGFSKLIEILGDSWDVIYLEPHNGCGTNYLQREHLSISRMRILTVLSL